MMKHNKKNRLLRITVICILILVSVGVFYSRINRGSAKIDGETETVFNISVFPLKIEDDNGIQRINYKVILENQSEQTLEKLKVYFELDSRLLPYLASGVQTVDMGEYTLVSREKAESTSGMASRVECRYAPALVDEAVLTEDGLSYEDCLEFGKPISVILKWNGGEETHDYVISDE